MSERPAGRPPIYTEEIAAEICGRIAEGESLRSICRDPDMPALSSIFLWVKSQPGFSEQYALAMQARADAHFEDILEIADDARNDWMERNGEDAAGWQVNGEAIQRSRLRIDARKWMAGKMRPKVYGDKIGIGGADDLPPIRTEEIGAATARLMAYLDAVSGRASGVPE